MNKFILTAAFGVMTSGATTLVSVTAQASDPNNVYGPSLSCTKSAPTSASCSIADSFNQFATSTGSATTIALSALSYAESTAPIHTESEVSASFSDTMVITGGTGAGMLATTLQLQYETFIVNAAAAYFEGTQLLSMSTTTGFTLVSFSQTIDTPFTFGVAFPYYASVHTDGINPDLEGVVERPESHLTVQGFSVTDQNGNPVQAEIFIDGTLVPEPGTSTMILLGFVLSVFVRRLPLTADAAWVRR